MRIVRGYFFLSRMPYQRTTASREKEGERSDGQEGGTERGKKGGKEEEEEGEGGTFVMCPIM